MSEWPSSVGILIIGSLYWDTASHRKMWRRDRLDQDQGWYVRAPIRYGRQSQSRGNSYTMVFSASLSAADYGRALVVPCRRRVRNAADIVDEAVHLSFYAIKAFDCFIVLLDARLGNVKRAYPTLMVTHCLS